MDRPHTGLVGRKNENINKFIADDIFEASLKRFLPLPPKNGAPIFKRLRDAQFRQLAEFCSRAGYPQWGLRPRTYAVLRMIGYPEAIEKFLDEKLTDIFLPYSKDNLPGFISGEARERFLNCQNFVLNGRAAALERPGESHQNFEGSADDYFLYVEDLGAGGFGEVDSVIGQMSLVNFARKRIKRHRLFAKDKESLRVFENELQTLKALSHRHLVRLVGSYTDSSCVGLIMTPVADMNLATYLRRTMNPESRKICLRRFFGCLAAALTYLHDQRVQHKDIKPANILVKQQHVYLTDFGTSRSWDNEASKSTQGTVVAFTPRYCAPEVVQFGSSRNETRDIWSLGCVFFEMCSVLADHTVKDMWQFLRNNGTQGEYIRENSTGVQAWTDVLRSDISTLHDQWPIELAGRMCDVEPKNRPVAREVVSMIFNFDSPIRYYGLCCDEQFDLKRSLSNRTIPTEDFYEDDSLLREPARTEEYNEVDLSLPLGSRYRFPTAEDPTEDKTVQAFFPPGGIARRYTIEDAELPGASSDLPKFPSTLTQSTLHTAQSILARPALDGSLQKPVSPDLENRVPVSKVFTGNPVLNFINNLNVTQLPCPWPKFSGQSRFSSYESLVDHLRDCHGTHEVFWTQLFCPSPTGSPSAPLKQWLPGQIISDSTISRPSYDVGAFVLKRGDFQLQASTDPYADYLRSRITEIKQNFGKVNVASSRLEPEAVTTLLPIASSSDEPKSQEEPGFREEDPVQKELRAQQEAQVNSDEVEVEPQVQEEPKVQGDPKVQEEPRAQEEPRVQLEPIVSPDPLSEPSLSSFIGNDSQPEPPCVPKSSFVPSYHLAATNRLSEDQIKSMLAVEKPLAVPQPLFVYGSLMFPSILRAHAENSISAEGIYSKALQRRIQSSAADWSNMNESLQQTAQQMTPALLRDYSRFKDNRSGDAALAHRPSGKDGTFVETKGFLVVGLSHEALVCLDYHFSDEAYDNRYGASSAPPKTPKEHNRARIEGDGSDDDVDRASHNENAPKLVWRGGELHRQTVMVTVNDFNGKPQMIEAITYKYKDEPDQEMNAWDLDAFVKHRAFERLSKSTKRDGNGNYGLLVEEEDIALKLGMSYVMRGDELCDKIVKNDVEGVHSLVGNGSDVDAFCRLYGTPLQAAAANGHEQLVYVMLESWNADANKQGGPYNFPLVAAICNGHEDIVNTLLKHGANPIVAAGSYVSPVYQAVSFEDVEMTRMLLERGAWLSKDYIELLDLAKETGNSELCDLLRRYDIRNLWQSSQIKGGRDGKAQKPNDQIAPQRSQLSFRKVMPALLEVYKLKGQKGKWTGMKAIKVLRVAYGENIPDDVLHLLGTNLGTIQQMLMMLVNNEWPWESNPHLSSERDESSDQRHSIDTGKANSESKISSQRKNLPASQVASRIIEQKGHEPDAADNDVICLTCEGRGGRKGTGRRCERCHGRGMGSFKHLRKNIDSKVSQPQLRCPACNGTGNIFSERDKCRACNYGGEREGKVDNQGKEKYTGVPISRRVDVDDLKTEQTREHSDPPPPYPGRT